MTTDDGGKLYRSFDGGPLRREDTISTVNGCWLPHGTLAEYLGIEATPQKMCGSLKDGMRCVLPEHTSGHCVGPGEGWLRPTWHVDHPDVHNPDVSALVVGIEIERIDMPHDFVMPAHIGCDRCCISYEEHEQAMAETKAELVAAGWREPGVKLMPKEKP